MHLYYIGPFKFTALSQNKVSESELKTSLIKYLEIYCYNILNK